MYNVSIDLIDKASSRNDDKCPQSIHEKLILGNETKDTYSYEFI